MPRRPRFRNSLWSVVCLALPFACCGADATPAARSLESVLQELEDAGVAIVYSSELLTPQMQAPAVLPGRTPLQRAVIALAANGLELQKIAPGHYAVVRAPERPAPVIPRSDDAPLEEVSVYASRYAIAGRYLAPPRELSSADIDLLPGSNDDALRALRALPGLATNISARPYIRGSLSEDVLVRYDGVTLLDPFHLKDFQSLISAIDPAAIDRLEVFSGGFPVQFGTRAGGVIDISAPERNSGYENRAGLSLISGGVSTIGRSENLPLDWFAALRRSTLDLLEPVQKDLGKPSFSDSLGRLRWRTERGAWTLGWLLLDDRLDLGSIEDEEVAHARYRDEYAWLTHDCRLSDSLRTRTTAVVTSAERERTGTVARPNIVSGALAENQEFDRFELNNMTTWEPDAAARYVLGAEFAVSRSQYQYSRHATYAPAIAAAFGRPATDALDYVVRPSVVTYALYASARHQWRGFEAEVGARLDGQNYNLGESHNQISPRLNLRYDLDVRLRLYASIGRFTQARHVENWRVEAGQTTSDPAQSAIHTVLGLAGETAAGARWTIEAYNKRWKHATPYFDNRLDPLTLLPDLAPDRTLVTPRESEASGLELSVRKSLSEQLSVSSTLSWSRVADDLGDGDVLRSWDQPLAFSSGVSWQDSRANVALLAGWHRGWPRTPYDLGPPDLRIAARNSQRWEDFYSVDLRGSWLWPKSKGDLTLTLDVTNATNRNNSCCANLESSAGAQFPTAETGSWLPLVANIGIAFRWHGGD